MLGNSHFRIWMAENGIVPGAQCWVFGEDSTYIFSVQIDGDNNVSVLKKAIKDYETGV
jgi:hypothetical protein